MHTHDILDPFGAEPIGVASTPPDPPIVINGG
jgi:hypothetical protein